LELLLHGLTEIVKVFQDARVPGSAQLLMFDEIIHT
jgi:hypothetical protein